MSFQQGLSGLAGASKALDVIGNNIANSGTVGFKQSQTQFADIYARSLNGVSGAVPGIGVAVSQIAQQFSQGNIETSANPLDIAINGGGFFRTEVNGAIQYSRNGQFQVDKNGFMINAQLAKVTGYLANTDGKILAGVPVPIQIDPSDMLPNATAAVDTQINLNSKSEMPSTAVFDADDPTSYNKQIPTEVFDSLGNNHVLSTFYVKSGPNTWSVYAGIDGLELSSARVAAAVQDAATVPGAAAIAARASYQAAVTTGFDVDGVTPLTPTAAALAYSLVAGAAMTAAATTPPPPAIGATPAQLLALLASYDDPLAPGTPLNQNGSLTPDQIDAALAATVKMPALKVGDLVFTSSGTLDKTAMLALHDPQDTSVPSDPLVTQPIPFVFQMPVFPATGANKPMRIEFDLTGSTQIFAATSEKKTVQDGYSGGALATFATGADGIILGQYSNGRTRPLAQIVLANFANVNGLEPQGNNAWVETTASGSPLVGEPNTGRLGLLRSSATETSNVDLTTELVNMITAQRAYQANAQTIKTQDSVMQTLVNLR